MILAFIALCATILAIILAFAAWRVAREERRQSDARVASLAEAIRAADNDPDVPLSRPMLAGMEHPAQRRRVGLLRLLGGLASAAIVLGVVFLGTGSQARRAPATAQQMRAAQPIELVALSHERERGDPSDRSPRTLTIKGTIRGVVSGGAGAPELERLEAVAVVYDAAGNLVATGQAPVVASTASRSPSASVVAQDSAFTIVIPAVRDVARYRVSFKLDGRTIPHVDRRKGS